MQNLRNNGSIYLHVYVMKHGEHYDANKIDKKTFLSQYTAHASRQLNKFRRLRFVKTQNLLTGETAATPEEIEVSCAQTGYDSTALLSGDQDLE